MHIHAFKIMKNFSYHGCCRKYLNETIKNFHEGFIAVVRFMLQLTGFKNISYDNYMFSELFFIFHIPRVSRYRHKNLYYAPKNKIFL